MPIMPGYRSNDAVLTICQNNQAKSITIHEVNAQGEALLGYKAAELAQKSLSELLPPRIAGMLQEYVEFEADANDVGMVLAKVQSFSVIGKDGKENGFRLKVVRAESTGDKLHFQLVLQDKAGIRRSEALRSALQENFKGHEVIDTELGLPDRYSLAKDVELMGFYNNKGDIRSCFAILQLDHYDSLFSQYGKPTCIALMQHIAGISKQSLRPDDVLASVNYKRIGVLLLDTTPESARMVFNRLRWQIAANPFTLPDRTSIGLSVSISFARVGGRIGERSLIETCDAALDEQGDSVANALIEVGESGIQKPEARSQI